MDTIPYGRQNISEDDINAVVETLQSDFLTQGPKIKEFEDNFAEYIGSKYAVAVNNGTAALHLAVLALGLKEGQNVITTPITFSATANCVRYCGANVYFADINPDTFLLDINKVRALIESKPKGFFTGIIPVDFAGYAINMEEFRSIANEYNLWIIEDACHAPGGYFIDENSKKQMCGNGNLADVAVFSFHPVKHIACGEGGMITTNDEKLYKKLLLLRTHGITKEKDLLIENHGGWFYEMQVLGYNYRLPDILAALGISQLKRAAEGLILRKEIAKRYDLAFENKKNILVPQYKEGHAFHLYIIQVSDRLGLYEYLRKYNIFAQVHYIPVHLMPYYKSLGFNFGDFPVAENFYSNCLSLPMYPTLTIEEQNFVIRKVIEYYL